MLIAHRPSRLRFLVLVTVAALMAVTSVSGALTARAEEAGDTVVGELVQTWAEPEGPEEAVETGDEGPLSWIATSDGETVRVPTEDLEQLGDGLAGATVSVTVGDEIEDEAATEEGVEPAREVLEAEVVTAAPSEDEPAVAESVGSLTHRVTVVLVQPGGAAADTRTVQQVVDAVNGPVADFWAGQSDGAVQIGVTASHDWRTTSATCSSPVQLWDEVAGQIGWSRAAGEHLMLYLPSTLTSCSYGIAEVGTGLNGGGRLYVRDLATSLIAHELGHNFSLGHSSAFQCDRTLDTGVCRVQAYYDLYDVMGASWDQVGSLNASHAAQLALLPEEQQLTHDASGRGGHLTLAPVSGRAGLRAVELVGRDGAEYWLEYRIPGGQDSWLGSATDNVFALDSGVTLRRTSPMPDTSLLLDGTPSSSADWDSDLRVALPVGRAVSVAGGAFTVTVGTSSSSGAAVRVATAASAPFPRDWSGDAQADLQAVDLAGRLLLYPGSGNGGFQPRRVIGSGWGARDLITTAGDWDGDGRPDMVARNPGNGDLWLYSGDDSGGFLGWRVIGRGWHVMDALWSPGDWDGDGHADLLARQRSDGALLLYPGNGSGGFGARSKIGTGWGVMADLAATGDWDGNGGVDFVARDWAGYLYLYSGNGSGGFTGRRVIGSGWQIFSQISGPGDWNGDGRSDLLAQGRDGALFLYPGNGTGGFVPRKQIGSGWAGYRLSE